MKKRVIVGAVVAGVLLIGAVGGGDSKQTQTNNVLPASTSIPEEVIPTCDGSTITTGCTLDGASYKTYIYHPAVAEKTHTETTTTYKEEITGYCTLCNDGTRSPSCATGRGTCSHHGGVAQWNAPISSSIPVNSTQTVIDAPAQDAYYERVLE